MGGTGSKRLHKRKSFLACISCRTKKVKCDIHDQFPCTSCRRSGSKCVRSTVDKRKERSESEYVKSLEVRLKMYEDENSRISSQLTDIASVMKDLSNLNRIFVHRNSDSNNVDSTGEASNAYAANDSRSNSYSIPESMNINVKHSHEFIDFDERYPTPNSFKALENKSVSVYGPTSVFDSISVSKSKNNKEIEEIDQLNRDPMIIECIKLFFNWQYPDIHIFIFREAFLLDFFHAKPNSSYCSKELIFSICSIGSLLSDTLRLKESSAQFYEKARILCLQNYNKPSIALLQSFLLLGLYDIYNGKNDSGWILSGIAMRIGYNIGFQLNPKSWSLSKTADTKSEFSTKIRSRIFWGTYIVDHLIGLLLGRPSSLKMNDTTIQETIELPNIDWIDEYSFQGINDTKPKILKIGDPLRSIVNLMDITENMLNDIFNDKQDKKRSFKNFEIHEKLLLLGKYNLKISHWRNNLSETEAWNIHDLDNLGNDPTKLTFKLLYYIVVLCLNRPFLNVGVEDDEPQGISSTNSAIICANSINDLTIAIRRFVKVHGFSKCSILIIYCCVISISVMLLFNGNTIRESVKEKGVVRYRILLFMMTLKKCANIWGLSDKSYKMIKAKLKQDFEVNIDVELDNFDPFDEIDFFSQVQSIDSDLFNNTNINSNAVKNTSFSEKLDDTNGNVNRNASSTEILDDSHTSDESPENMNSLDNKGDSFGGPPIFMTSTIYSSWEHLFPDYNFDNFNYEV